MLAAQPPDFQLAATPKLFVVAGKVGAGRPNVYVAFRSKRHLHEPRLVVAAVHGHHGRTYASRHVAASECYRSTLRTSDVTAGHRYKVTFALRPTPHSSQETIVKTVTLVARAFNQPARGLTAPAC
jgi:hypothetical protein